MAASGNRIVFVTDTAYIDSLASGLLSGIKPLNAISGQTSLSRFKGKDVIRVELENGQIVFYLKYGQIYSTGPRTDYFCGSRDTNTIKRVGVSKALRFIPGGASNGTESYILKKDGKVYKCTNGFDAALDPSFSLNYTDWTPSAFITNDNKAGVLGSTDTVAAPANSMFKYSGDFAMVVPKYYEYKTDLLLPLLLGLGIPFLIGMGVLAFFLIRHNQGKCDIPQLFRGRRRSVPVQKP